MIAFSTTPILHQNKPARESIFCGKVSDWWIKRALIMLKIMPKTRQKKSVAYTRTGNGTENTFAYDRQHERLQGMLLTCSGNNIMQTQK